jgi:5-methylcytosine-specific restriction enzyme A
MNNTELSWLKTNQSLTNKYDKHQRDQRSTAFYRSKLWKEHREYVFNKHLGLCQSCLKDNIFVRGSKVDHKITIKVDWSKRLEEDNLQVLCHRCHNRKTAAERK